METIQEKVTSFNESSLIYRSMAKCCDYFPLCARSQTAMRSVEIELAIIEKILWGKLDEEYFSKKNNLNYVFEAKMKKLDEVKKKKHYMQFRFERSLGMFAELNALMERKGLKGLSR